MQDEPQTSGPWGCPAMDHISYLSGDAGMFIRVGLDCLLCLEIADSMLIDKFNVQKIYISIYV